MVLRESIDENRAEQNCSIHDFLEYTMKRSLVVFIMALGFVSGVNAQTITDFTAGTPISASAMNANFDNIIAEFTALKARVAELEDDLPLGTVIASFIAPDGQYMTGSTEWALADGSNPEISYTGPFPDMSGRFLRGMDVPPTDVDPDPRTIGSLQDDALQVHKHQMNMNGGSSGTDYAIAPTNSLTSFIAKHSVYMADGVESVPGVTVRTAIETRPVNVAVYWYIKVK